MENLLPFVQLHVNVLLGMLYFVAIHVYLLSHYPLHIPVDQAYGIYVCIKPITLLFIYFYRKSASCTHVSAVLHCLASLNPASFQLRPNLPPAHVVGDDDTTPVTSLPCQWKRPKKQKESTLQVSKATFEKHDYAKPMK